MSPQDWLAFATNPQDWLISSLEVGNIISGFFFGALTLQVFNYYVTFPKDRSFLKTFVAYVWLLELGHFITCAQGSFVAIVLRPRTHESDPSFPIGLGVSGFFASFIGLSVEAFLIYRIWVLSKKLWIPVVLWSILFMQFICNIIAGVILIVAQQTYGHILQWLNTLIWVEAMFVDICIPVAMCYYLGMQRNSVTKSTEQMVLRVLKFSIQTGILSCLTGATLLITEYAAQKTYVWIPIHFFWVRVYGHTLLVSLNARAKPADDTPRLSFAHTNSSSSTVLHKPAMVEKSLPDEA